MVLKIISLGMGMGISDAIFIIEKGYWKEKVQTLHCNKMIRIQFLKFKMSEVALNCTFTKARCLPIEKHS